MKQAPPALRVVAIADLSGYLEPCGCQSRPLGGIDKAARKLAELRADGVPTLFVSTGDLLFGEAPIGASPEAATQELWKAESLVDILGREGLFVAAPGARDRAYGQAELDKLKAAAKFRFLPYPTAQGAPASASELTKVGSLSVGVVGVASFTGADAELEPSAATALQAEVQQKVDALHAQGAQLVLALVSTSTRDGRRLTSKLHGVDFVVQAGLTADGPVPVPARIGDSVVLRAGRQGHGLLVLEVRPGKLPFVDQSAWTRAEASKGLDARISDLRARVDAWRKDPSVDKADLAEQERKLAALSTERKSSSLAALAADGGASFEARFEELGPEAKPDSTIAALMDGYDARVNTHNREAFANVLPLPVAVGAPRYVGSAACQGCHATQFAWWSRHPHGNAYATLVTRHKEFNLSCVGCHVTGYNQPGGAAVVHNDGLINVGCESCHGPSSDHVAHPDAKPTRGVQRSVAELTCKQCHTPEHSDLFEYTAYRARLLVPGHGLPAPKAAP